MIHSLHIITGIVLSQCVSYDYGSENREKEKKYERHEDYVESLSGRNIIG